MGVLDNMLGILGGTGAYAIHKGNIINFIDFKVDRNDGVVDYDCIQIVG